MEYCYSCNLAYIVCTICPGAARDPHCDNCGVSETEATRVRVPAIPFYQERNNRMSTSLSDMIEDATNKLGELEDAENTLSDALEQVRDFVDKLEEAKSALEEIDGYSISVNVDEIAVDFTFYL